MNAVELGSNGFERFFIFRFNITVGFVIFISVYVLIFFIISDVKDKFYDRFVVIISSILSKEEVVFLGNFNVRVGFDYDSWFSCFG